MFKWKKVYFIGIKGVGMTALAEILHRQGIEVSGSDTKEKFFTEETLKKLKIPYFEEFKASNIPEDVEAVIFSTAYGESNPEIQEAKQRKLPLISYPEAVGMIFNEKIGIAIAGSHGKTTTSAMLGLIFEQAGLNPTVLVGSTVRGSDPRGKPLCGAKGSDPQKKSASDFFILEADEYQNKFQFYNPKALIITSIDWDHPDFFPTKESYQKTFEDFIARVPQDGIIIGCGEDENVVEACKKAKAKVILYEEGQNLIKFSLQVPGRHNMLNASAAALMAKHFGIKNDVIEKALKDFKGTKRRLELKGTISINQSDQHKSVVKVYDDYAHAPKEIEATLAALRQMYPQEHIVAVFQPHTFSRTKTFLKEFAQSFENADEVILLPVYASAREKASDISSENLLVETQKHHKNVLHFHSFEEVVAYLKNVTRIREFTRMTRIGELLAYLRHSHKDLHHSCHIIVTLGAGDVWRVGEIILA